MTNVDDFLKRYEAEIKEQQDMVKKDDYMKWLESFTKEHPSFSDDTWLYRKEEISEEDYNKVCKLSTFFCAIEGLTSQNYISGTSCAHGVYYSIEYNGKIYEIGTIVGQGAISFCNTENVDENVTAIKFEEFANPSEETRIRTALIENQLDRINDLFAILVNNKKLNIPIEVIEERATEVIRKLKEKD